MKWIVGVETTAYTFAIGVRQKTLFFVDAFLDVDCLIEEVVLI